MRLDLFTVTNCPRCTQAVRVLQRVSRSIGPDQLEWRVVDVLDEIDYAVSLGVLATPAIAIDGKLVFTSLPPEKKLRKELMKRT